MTTPPSGKSGIQSVYPSPDGGYSLRQIRTCTHPHTELRYRAKLDRRKVFRHQCQNATCLRGIGPEWEQGDRGLPSKIARDARGWRKRRLPNSGRRAYAKYIRSGHWRLLRKQALERDGYCCRTCGDPSDSLHVHHVDYPTDLYDTTLEMVLSLCEDCHEEGHGRR